MEQRDTLTRLTGVYHAEGSLLGELRYIVGKLRGTTHCALCEVTHGAVRKKAEFRTWQSTLPVPLDLVHLDERSTEIAAFTEGRTPAIVGHSADRLVFLLGAQDLELGGDVEQFANALSGAVDAAQLQWPQEPPR